MYHQKNSLKWFSRSRSFFLFAMLCVASACSEPDVNNAEKDKTAIDLSNLDDKYVFDIAMLSEWAGNILQRTAPIKFVLTQDNKCYVDKKNGSDVIGFECNIISDDNTSVFDLMLSYNPEQYGDFSKDGNQEEALSCIKKSCDNLIKSGVNVEALGDNAKLCYKINKQINEIYDGTKNSEFHLLECHWKVGGADTLYNVFNTIPKKDMVVSSSDSNQKVTQDEPSMQIRVGVGDNFGLSPDVTSTFNDLPAIQMLSMMGFTVDTFGNHSFDNSLNYLNKILEYAGFPFVATSLVNVPQNLDNTYKYAIVHVPSANNDKNALPVAFISALDEDVQKSVFSGNFGTLDVGDFCSVAQTIEEAYNAGARAFFILGHLTAGSDSMFKVLNAIFSFADMSKEFEDENHCRNHLGFKETADETNASNDENEINSSNHNVGNCPSKLIIPIDRLSAVFDGVDSRQDFIDKYVNVSEEKYEENRTKYNQLASTIRKEIFDSIIGVMIEGSEQPMITPILFSESSVDHAFSYQCHTNINNNQYKVDDIRNKSNLNSDLPLFIRQTKQLNTFEKQHPIWLIQVPPNGKQIGNLRVEVTKTVDKFYSKALSYSLSPVAYSDQIPEVDVLKISDCDSLISDLGLEFPSCQELYEKMRDRVSYDEGELQNCSSTLTKNAGNSKQDYSQDDIQMMQKAWHCLNAAKSYIQCEKGEEMVFTENVIFNLGKFQLPNTTEIQDRSESTARTGVVADIILDYVNYFQEDNEKYHAVLINSGTVRGENALKIITVAGVGELVPFKNHIKEVTLTSEQLAGFIKQGLDSQIKDKRGDSGAFPVVSGIHYSASKIGDSDDKYQYQVNEIWLVNEKGALTKPVYLRKNEVESYILADYTLNNDRYQITKKDDLEYEFNETSFEINNNEKIRLISLDYILSSGDEYKITDLGISKDEIKDIKNLKVTELAEVVKSYLSQNQNSDKTDDDKDDNKDCPNYNTINYVTITDKTAEDLYCRSMINRYFIDNNGYGQKFIDFWINVETPDEEFCDSYTSKKTIED